MPKLLPLIGYPTKHSAAAAVQQAALAAEGVEIEIEPWEKRPHELPAAIGLVRSRAFNREELQRLTDHATPDQRRLMDAADKPAQPSARKE